MVTTRLNIERPVALWRHVAAWLVCVFLGLGVLALAEFRLQLDELETESTILYRNASQLAGQHDAHLTALSAVAVAGAGPRVDLFRDVSATVMRFYPRIDAVYLVPLRPGATAVSSSPLAPDLGEAIRAAAKRSNGVPVLLPHPQDGGHYLLVKRSPNTDQPIYALAISVDAAALVASDAPFWTRSNVAVRLRTPDGVTITGSANLSDNQFSKTLDSASQPLTLETAVDIGLSGLLPPRRVLTVLVLISFAFIAVLAGLRQRARLRAAEQEAELRRVEAKLTHASRINSMGEMASGMAHELTQPLTAILAQLQAGQRLLARGDTAQLQDVLSEAIDQSRRSAAILERLRTWSKPHRAAPGRIDLREVVTNVEALLAAEARQRGVAVDITAPTMPVMVDADQVEMEQVVHNLIRNAMEAQESQPDAFVRVSLAANGETARLEIADNGPGVAASVMPALFTPFTTTRTEGTGLGLALSQRLIERAGGEISHVPGGPGATFRILLPLAGIKAEAAE